MPIGFKRAYLYEIRTRYQNARKKEKTAILDEFCRVCGYRSRKHAIQILRGKANPVELKRTGPRPIYQDAVPALKELYGLMSGICSKRMRAAMPLWLQYYQVTPKVSEMLLKMSASTIDRLLRAHRSGFNKGLSTTSRPRSMMKLKIPLKLLDGHVKVPGYFEGDTVAHCGTSIAGEYANTLTTVDLFSSWTELRATWTKDANQITSAMEKIESKVPFAFVGFASDNGSEFINETLYRYFTEREAPINFVRRRPYKKNDNAHVEQKNFTHVRELFGYQRLDDPRLVPMMNEIYQAYWCPLQNLFTPAMKLIAKERIGSQIKKHYDQPKTPAQRLLDSPLVPHRNKALINDMIHSKNPIDLKRRLDEKLKEFFKLTDELERSRRLTGS